MHDYRPRRAGARWLQDAPEYILDVFDSKNCGERYTVLFGGSLLISDGTRTGTYVQGLGMSDAPTHPQGVSMWFELKPHEQAAYRYREGKHRIKWMDLPQHIRKHVIARATEDSLVA
jgi:hypothetical protein